VARYRLAKFSQNASNIVRQLSERIFQDNAVGPLPERVEYSTILLREITLKILRIFKAASIISKLKAMPIYFYKAFQARQRIERRVILL